MFEVFILVSLVPFYKSLKPVTVRKFVSSSLQ